LSCPAQQTAHTLYNCTKVTIHFLYPNCIIFNFFVLFLNIWSIKNCQLFFTNFFTGNSEIHTHNTRPANDLHLPNVNSLRGIRCVKFKASLLWNNLPTKLQEIENLGIFKNNWLIFFYLKMHLTKRQIIAIYRLTLWYI